MDVQAMLQPHPPVNTDYDETAAATAFLQQFNEAAEATKTRPACETVRETVSLAPTLRLIDDQETAAAAACLQQLNEAVEANKTVSQATPQQAVYDVKTADATNFLQLIPVEPTTPQLIDEAEALYFQQHDTAPSAQLDESMDWWDQPVQQELPPLPNLCMTPPLLQLSQPMSTSSQDQWGGEVQQTSQVKLQEDRKASQSQPQDAARAPPAPQAPPAPLAPLQQVAPLVAQPAPPSQQQQAAPPPPQQQAAPPAAPPPPQQQAALNNAARQVTLY